MFVRLFGFAAICLSLASPLTAQNVSGDALTPQQFFDVGITMMREGKPQDAANVADALLIRTPNDPSALILRAEAAIQLRDFASGVKFGRAAYTATDIDNQKFAAARLVALAHSQSKNDTLAQLWLRRARQFSPNAQTANAVAEDYQLLRRRNPWSTQLRFSVTPSSNLNNGGANATAEIDFLGLPLVYFFPDDERALSGVQISTGFDTRYRLTQNRRSITHLTLGADLRTYALSNAAKKLAPDARGSNYGDANLRFGINHRRILTDGGRPTDFALVFGQTWVNGDDFDNITADSKFVQARLSHSWQLSDNDVISASLSAKKETYTDGDPDAKTNALYLRWGHQFENRNQFYFGVNVTDKDSSNPNVRFKSLIYTTSYELAKPIAGMQFGFGIDYEQRDYETSIFASGSTREDRTLGLNMSIEFRQVEFYGFRPVMSIDLRRNDSSIELFDRDYTNVGFDLRSSF